MHQFRFGTYGFMQIDLFYLLVWFCFAFVRYYVRININNQLLSIKDLTDVIICQILPTILKPTNLMFFLVFLVLWSTAGLCTFNTFVCLFCTRCCLSFFSFSLCQELAVACDCGTPWYFKIFDDRLTYSYINKVIPHAPIWFYSNLFIYLFIYLLVGFYFAFVRYYMRININNRLLSIKDLTAV